MKRIGIALQIAFVLADRDMSDAPTLGDLCDVLGLRTGTAIGERLREARKYYGFDINHFEIGEGRAKEHRYFIPPSEREKIRERPDYQEWKKQRSAAA